MIRAGLPVARIPLSCFSPISRRGEKQDKSVHSSRLPPIISTKQILRRRTLFNRNGFVKKKRDLLLAEKEVQYSLLFPDIFVSVGGDKQDFSNLI